MTVATVVVGNPKPESRTRALAEAVMDSVLRRLGDDARPVVIDLASHQHEIFDASSEEVGALTRRVAESHLVVAASPTYKAAYTGLFKAFFDRYQADALAGVVVIPVMVAAAPVHALAPEVFMRPLFVELGATLPPRSVFLLESEITAPPIDAVERWVERNVPRFAPNISLD